MVFSILSGLFVLKFGDKKTEEFDRISREEASNKLNSLRSLDYIPNDRKLLLSRNIKINEKRRKDLIQINATNLLLKFPLENFYLLRSKNNSDSKEHPIDSAEKSLFHDSSQNSYSTIFKRNDDNTDENFLSLGIKISFSETSSTLAKTKGALGETNFGSLIFVALRHQEPVFQSFKQNEEDSNVMMYGPLVLLIKAERNGIVLNEENNGIRVEIDFPKTQHQSFQMKMGNMRKVFSKNTVGNATYDNFDYHCVVWDAWLNTFRKDSKVCQTQPINATHTKCICKKTGRFGLISTYNGSNVIKGAINYPVNGPINGDNNGKGLLFDGNENNGFATQEGEQVNVEGQLLDNEMEYEDLTFMIIIIAISSSVLVVTILGIGLLVFYCKRVKVRIFNKTQNVQNVTQCIKASNL